MKEIKKEIYRVNRNWFNLKSKQVVGDMFFHFQMADDSRTTDINQLILNVKDNVKDNEIGTIYDLDDKESIPIYLFEKATAFLELEDDEDENVFEDRLDIWEIEGYWKTIYSIAVCTKDYAEKVGLSTDKIEPPISEFFH